MRMGSYRVSLIVGERISFDTEGEELPDDEAAIAFAYPVANDFRKNRLPDSAVLRLENSAGEVVFEIPLSGGAKPGEKR